MKLDPGYPFVGKGDLSWEPTCSKVREQVRQALWGVYLAVEWRQHARRGNGYLNC